MITDILPLTLLQFVTDPNEIKFEKIVSYGLAGAAYNLAAYSNTATKTGESWQLHYASRTIFLGLLAGGIVAISNDEFTPANFETAMYLAIPIADQLIGSGLHLRDQIEHNQFSDWGDTWYFSGSSPSSGSTRDEIVDDEDAIGPERTQQAPPEHPSDAAQAGLDPAEYFDVIDPEDEDEDGERTQ